MRALHSASSVRQIEFFPRLEQQPMVNLAEWVIRRPDRSAYLCADSAFGGDSTGSTPRRTGAGGAPIPHTSAVPAKTWR